jgi:hypothetical protein
VEEPSARLVWRDWILASCLSAVIGVGTATVAGVALFRFFGPHWFRYAASFVAFTVVNAGVTATLQYRVLVAPLPYLHRNQWVLSTLLGSILTWSAAFLTPFAEDLLSDGASEWWLTQETSIALGVGLGFGMGIAQMMALIEWVRDPWKWVVGSTLAWAVATPALWYVAREMGSDEPLRALPLAAGLLLLAGVVVGLIEGFVVRSLGHRDEAAIQYTRSALDEIGSIDLGD